MSDKLDDLLRAMLMGPNPFCDKPYDADGETLYCRQAPGHDGACGDLT